MSLVDPMSPDGNIYLSTLPHGFTGRLIPPPAARHLGCHTSRITKLHGTAETGRATLFVDADATTTCIVKLAFGTTFWEPHWKAVWLIMCCQDLKIAICSVAALALCCRLHAPAPLLNISKFTPALASASASPGISIISRPCISTSMNINRLLKIAPDSSISLHISISC